MSDISVTLPVYVLSICDFLQHLIQFLKCRNMFFPAVLKHTRNKHTHVSHTVEVLMKTGGCNATAHRDCHLICYFISFLLCFGFFGLFIGIIQVSLGCSRRPCLTASYGYATETVTQVKIVMFVQVSG